MSINQGRVGFRDRIAGTIRADHRVSINQGRVGFRDSTPSSRKIGKIVVSINQGRVGFRDVADRHAIADSRAGVHQSGPRRLPRPRRRACRWGCARVHQSGPRRLPRRRWRMTTGSPSQRVHQSGPRRLPRLLVFLAITRLYLVSINQGRVGFRDPGAACTATERSTCPSIRAASASATFAPAAGGGWLRRVHQSGPRRLPRRRAPRRPGHHRHVSINQGRVGFRDEGSWS